ncbi:hypothetical protein ACFLZI_02195 [Nitrospirota bacterium]
MRVKTRPIMICALLAFALLLGGCGEFKDKFEQFKDVIPKYEKALKELGKYKDMLEDAKKEVKKLKEVLEEARAEAIKYKELYEETKKENEELKRSLNRMYK